MDRPANPDKKILRVIVPWLVAAGFLLVYVVTLNHWVNYNNLLQVARTSGWTWQEELYGPVYWLVTYPLRWLPARLIPIALNLFSSVCAVLSLALLARSVMLLPHDRTHEQRQNEKSEFSLLSIPTAWLPPVLAALVCGLQLTFWQCATTSTSVWRTYSNEMFDLLLFAYIIRCVLESRIDEDRPWLVRASFVYGLAMTNNWAMIAYFPLFLAALIWIRGLSFFNPRFLKLMFFWGIAGLLLYFLLPLVQSLSNISRVPFWKALTEYLKFQRYGLAALPFNKQLVFKSGEPLWVVGLSSLLPVLVLSVRWPSSFGDPSRLGVAISTFIVQIAHAALFFLCLLVALGSQLSPNHLVDHIAPGMPTLTLFYLGALSIGYFSGYFLLVFRSKSDRSRRVPLWLKLINKAVQAAVWLIFLGVPAMLIQRNLPQIRETNGPTFHQYAAALAKGLPDQKAALYSDDTRRLFLLQSYLTQQGRSQNYIFVETGALEKPDYHSFLRKKYPGRWPWDPDKQDMDSPSLIRLATQLTESNAVYYLHPSFGYYFEAFYPEPHGLVYKLDLFPTNALLAPPLSDALIAENEAFWKDITETTLRPLLALVAPTTPREEPALMKKLTQKLHLVTESISDFSLLANFYSAPVVYWGAELQKSGRLTDAAARFEMGQQLNPDNVVATIDLDCNKALQSGHPITRPDQKALEDQFGKYRTWGEVVNANGPFDDPNFSYEQGRVFVQGGLFRQAAHQFARAKELNPANLDARLWLAQLYVMAKMPDQSLTLVKEIHAQPDVVGLSRTNYGRLLSVEASAHYAKGDLKAAEASIESALQKYPDADEILGVAARTYINAGQYSNALPIIDQELKQVPDHAVALSSKGYVCLQLGKYEEAIPPLSKFIGMETNNFSEAHYRAVLNRAIAYLRTDKLDEAQQDYETLQKVAPRSYQILYGLEEVAWRKHDTNSVIRLCESYLASSPENPAEINLISNRLHSLKAGKP